LSRFILSLGFVGALLLPLFAPFPATAGIVSPQESMAEMSIGKSDAPVTMIEYSSLGCPHCASFHINTLPQIKKEYIETGKVRLIFRDFPLGTPALAASMIARCAGPVKFFGFIEIIFRSQDTWARDKDPLGKLSQIARFGGLSEADVDTCLKQQTLLDFIRKGAATAQETHKVNSTPTFIIAGEPVSGAQPFENFKKIIDKALGK